jgi:hypothetical protein
MPLSPARTFDSNTEGLVPRNNVHSETKALHSKL